MGSAIADDKKFTIEPPDAGFEVEAPEASAKQAAPQTMGQQVLMGAEDFGKGALKGLGHTLGGLSPLINKIPYVGETLAPSAGIKAWEKTTEPSNTMQKAGFGTEQAAEFLLPTGIEEKGGLMAARALGKGAAPLGRIAGSALTTGALNKLQGGEFGTGALMGGAGGAIGEGMRAAAPALAESAIGVTKRMRGFGRTPGEAVLGEIKGIHPGTIAENAGGKLGELTKQLEQAAAKSTTPATTQPAIDVITAKMQEASKQNNKTLYNALRDVQEQLTKDFASGQPIPTQMPASKLLDLKRGIGDLEGTWNPDLSGKMKGIVRQVYSALDKELDRTVPEADKLNQRISSLIPVKKAAASTERNADIAQRVAHRVAAHTGALVGAGAGGAYGYREGGLPGAVTGGMIGLVGPELVASPSAQMLGARVMRSGAPAKIGRAAASQLMRRDSGESAK